jgi:hypothetical protein
MANSCGSARTRTGRGAGMKIGPIHISLAALLIIVILVILLA